MPPKLKSIPAVASQPKPSAQRGQIPEERPPFRIPTPEELGLGAATPPTPEPSEKSSSLLVTQDAPLDWTLVERKLDQAGSTGYQMEKTATGFRFTVQLASGSIAGRGANKNEAVRNALSQLR